MTDRCAPPDGSPSGWYWIDMSRGPHLARWNADRQVWWPIDRGGITPFEMQHSGYRYLRPCRPDDAEARERLETEVERLLALINTPTVDDWFAGVRTEAAHQQERWGSSHDAGKSPLDWFWLIGYLAQKVVSADTTEKALHHTVSTAAALFNWHQAISATEAHEAKRAAEDTAQKLEAENKRLRDLIHAILAADERGQGLPFATAMDAAREAVDGKNT